MQTYVVTRPDVAAGASGLDVALSRLRSFEEDPGTLRARWLHSYALRQADGRFGLACVFAADGIQALQRHAEVAGLPVREILPVATQLRARPLAPALVYLVRRRAFGKSAADIERCLLEAQRLGEQTVPRSVSWLGSYAVHEPDGSLGTVCLYQGAGVEALREHARRAGLPADDVVALLGRVVFRDEAQARPLFAGGPGPTLAA